MRHVVASRIMARTTIDIDPAVLREFKRRQAATGKTLGSLVSEMLAGALQSDEPQARREFAWTSRTMRALIDLEDAEAVRRTLGE
jgi:hypothetical protein